MWLIVILFCEVFVCLVFSFSLHTLAMVLLSVSTISFCLFLTPGVIATSAFACPYAFPSGRQPSQADS